VEADMLAVLGAVAATNDLGEPADPISLAEDVSLTVGDVERILRRAQEDGLVGRVGKTTDHHGSPIERAPEGWMLLDSGRVVLGRGPQDLLDLGPDPLTS
jgi:hypothetical protein